MESNFVSVRNWAKNWKYNAKKTKKKYYFYFYLLFYPHIYIKFFSNSFLLPTDNTVYNYQKKDNKIAPDACLLCIAFFNVFGDDIQCGFWYQQRRWCVTLNLKSNFSLVNENFHRRVELGYIFYFLIYKVATACIHFS